MLSKIPAISGLSSNGSTTRLYDLILSERYVLIWWHPQILTPASCRSCSGIGEPVRLMEELHRFGCDIIGLSYADSDSLLQYQQDIGVVYPMLSVEESEAREFGVAKVSGEPWPGIPHRIAFLADEHGQVINRYEIHDPEVFLRSVLSDVKAGPPPSKWEAPKRKKFLGIF